MLLIEKIIPIQNGLFGPYTKKHAFVNLNENGLVDGYKIQGDDLFAKSIARDV